MPRLGNGRRSAAGSRLDVKFAVSGSEKDVNSPGLGRPPICVRPRLVDSQACRAVATKQATIRRVRPFFELIWTMGLHPSVWHSRDRIDHQPSNTDCNPDCHRVRPFLPLGSIRDCPPISSSETSLGATLQQIAWTGVTATHRHRAFAGFSWNYNSGSACSAVVEVET